MEHLLNVRIESLKIELDNNESRLLDKLNKLIRSKASNQKVTEKVFFKINDHRRNKKFKINTKKIGLFSLQINKKIANDVWRSENAERFLKKIMSKIL